MSKVALVLSMVINAGNASYGGESITIVDDMQTCKLAAEAYMRTKNEVRNISRNGSTLKFSIGSMIPDRYEISCREIEVNQNGF